MALLNRRIGYVFIRPSLRGSGLISHHCIAGLYLMISAFSWCGLCSASFLSSESSHHGCPSSSGDDSKGPLAETAETTAHYAEHNRAHHRCLGHVHPQVLSDMNQIPKPSLFRVSVSLPPADLVIRLWRPQLFIKSVESSNILSRTQKILV